MALGILAAIPGLINQGKQILDSTGLINHGASVPWTQADVAQMLSRASADQLTWLRQRWAEDSSKKGVAMPADAATFYYYAAGGPDGKVTSAAGKKFVEQVTQLIGTQGGTLSAGTGPASSGGTTLTPGSSSTAGSGAAAGPSMQASGLKGFITSDVLGVPVWALLVIGGVLVFFLIRNRA